MISVVIPTRNRRDNLLQILSDLQSQSLLPEHVVIVDSSDNFVEIKMKKYSFELIHLQGNIPSAAMQRNAGMKLVPSDTSIIAFLDDDIRIDEEYFKMLCRDLDENDLIGVSGIALGPNQSLRKTPQGFEGLVKRIFMLDSKKPGSLLSSGIGVPLQLGCDQLTLVDWLIACSCWKYEKIKDTEFPVFLGYSLGEDVIFSYLMAQKGKIAVNPKVILNHLESPVGRPNSFEFWRKWIIYRRSLLRIRGRNFKNLFCFWWANIGKILSLFISIPFKPEASLRSIAGTFFGLLTKIEMD